LLYNKSIHIDIAIFTIGINFIGFKITIMIIIIIISISITV